MSAPQPAFTVDFETGASNLPAGFKLMEGAAVKDGAPGAVAKALRIDSDGPYVLFPNLDISPSKYPELSMIIEFYLESIPEGSKGWLLNHDNGGYDRALALHDERFGGISHGVGYPAGPVYDSYTTPEVGKWVQMVVTYRQGGECAVFVSNEKAPITHEGRNNDGKSSLTLGRVVPYKNHWCDCWIKGVSVYDKGLSDEEVDSIFGKFKDEVIVPSGEASDDESVDEGEDTEPVDEDEDTEPVDDHTAVQNIALGKPASQSTTLPNCGGVASNAVNGSTTGKRKSTNSTVSCTAHGDNSPWWEVDLEGLYDICKINVFNRDGTQYRYKLKDFTVEVLRGGKVAWSSGSQTEIPQPEAIISIPGGTTGDCVRVSKNTTHLILAEVQVWGTPSSEVDTGSASDDATYSSAVESSKWKMIGDGGRLKQVSISASGEHLWGVNTKNLIYYRAGFNGHWKRIGGSLKYVSVSAGGNHVWGVNIHDHVYYRAGLGGSWKKIDGSLKQICVSADGGHVWGVTREDHIYYKAGIEDRGWKRIAGALKQVCVSASGKHVWGVNTHDHVYYRAGVGGSWKKIDGSLKHISVSAGGNHVWGVTREDHIYYREGLSAPSWTKTYGALKQICVSADGRHVWGVNSKDEIWYRFVAGWSVPTPPTNTKVIDIKNGDQFHYGPWGGNCIAFFAAGVLYMNRIGSSVQGIKTWKCKDVADTQRLLNGETVMVQWDNSGTYLKMTATDNDTFKVMHGSTAYYFKRAAPEPEPKPVISLTTGDQFHYGPWGGNCIAFFAAGVLWMNRIGSSVQGIKTWKCKNVADTQRLLNGETVMVQWDNGGTYLKMTATDNNTFKVMHGSRAYYFKRA